MPLTFTQSGSGSSGTSTATLSITSVTASVGDWLVVCVASDNAGTNGVASLTTSIADGGGVNVYTNQGGLINRTAGTTSDGATLGIWTAPVISALSNATITANFSPDTTRKVAVVWRVQPGTGEKVGFVSVGSGSSNSSSTPTITATSVANADTVIGVLAVEVGSASTADADTTNGSWSAQIAQSSDSGTNSTSMTVASQAKTVTATGNQTYNPTLGGSTRDWAINWLTLHAVAVTERLNNFMNVSVGNGLSATEKTW